MKSEGWEWLVHSLSLVGLTTVAGIQGPLRPEMAAIVIWLCEAIYR